MATFWDLLPAGAWPPQPFNPPFDPTQASWPAAALPQWNPATPSAYGWPAVPAASAGTTLTTQAGATGDESAVDDDPRVAEAKRAYDFARWMFGPPSTPPSPSMRATALTGAPRNVSPPPSDDPDQSAGLGAATGNPNIARQGARARASQRQPSSFWDLLPAGGWPVQPFIPPPDPTQPSAWPAQTTPPQWGVTPVAASPMSASAPKDASTTAPSPNAPAGATYNPLTWTAADNPLSWIQQQYERQYPERAAAMKRMADTRLGDVPSIDAPNAARRMAEGFAFGYGNEPIIPHQDIGPDTKIAVGGNTLPDWAQPDARFLLRSANVAPQLLDRALRAVKGGAYGAAGGVAGLYQDLGGSEPWADRLQRDLGILAQYPLTDLSLVRPTALEPRAPARALAPSPRDIAPLADSDAPASAPRSLAGPEAAVEVGPPSYTHRQANLIRDWLGIAPERFRIDTITFDPPWLAGELLDESGRPIGYIHRWISPDTGEAEHVSLELYDELQNAGFTKNILRANIAYYRKLGLSQVNVTAALDRGGYVWARYGFLPTQKSWDALRPVLTDKILDPSLDLTPAVRRQLFDWLQNRDPHAIWHIADIRRPVVIEGKPVMLGDKPLPLGNHLLSGTGWTGSLDLNDAEMMRRFDEYAGAKK